MKSRYFVFVLIVFSLPFISAYSDFGGYSSSTSFYSTTQPQPDFQTAYSGNIGTYWPILEERGKESQCEARQDLLIQVAPAGCQPVVVRSDLLAEQNVPVFCQLDALKLNPLIDIREIRNIQFRANYPKEVISTGFHPARAALRTKDRLLGSPMTSNIGYAVVVLRKNANESSLPSFVNLTLSARVEYESGNALGIGRAEFLLTPVDDETWAETESKNQSFWQGRYSVRVENLNERFADLSIYFQDRKVAGTRVERGRLSNPIYLPGSYCQAGLQASYDEYVGVGKKARIEIGDFSGLDSIDVVEGSTFLDGRCRVDRIYVDGTTNSSGNVSISCSSGERALLQIRQKIAAFVTGDFVTWAGDKQGNTWSVKEYLGNGRYNISSGSEHREVTSGELQLKQDQVLTSDMEKAYQEALKAYEQVAKEHPVDPIRNVKATSVYNPTYGAKALESAILLARQFGKNYDEARLIQKYIELYPETSTGYGARLQELYQYDTSLSSSVVSLDGKFRTLRAASITDVSGGSYVELQFANEPGLKRLNWRETRDIEITKTANGKSVKEVVGNIRLDDLNGEEAKITPSCVRGQNGEKIQLNTMVLKIGDPASDICGQFVTLDKINVRKAAKIRLIPKVVGTRSEVNVSVRIGIEKRAIQLSPDKALEKIENLNKSIKKWESINKNMEKVVTGLKSACFATSAVLTAKTFLTGLTGEGIARQQVMRGPKGWTNKCNQMINDKKYDTINQCYLGEANRINADVKAQSEAIRQVNQRIKSIEEDKVTKSGLLGEKSVNTKAAAKDYAEYLRKTYPEEMIGGKKLPELISADCYEHFECDYTTLRNIEQAILSKRNGVTDTTRDNLNSDLKKYEEQITLNKQLREKQIKDEELKRQGLGSATFLTAGTQQKVIAEVVPMSKLASQQIKDELTKEDPNLDRTVTLNVNGYVDSTRGLKIDGGTYIAGVKQTSQGSYIVQNIVHLPPSGSPKLLTKDETNMFTSAYNVGPIIAQDQVSYSNRYESPEIRFFETEPYKGMPAIVPFDTLHGWYAATKQTLPTFGGIGGFESSGRVSSFWLCNVGSNKREEFQQAGFGDDLCELINLNTGQTLAHFPGLNEEQTKDLVNKGVRALTEAAQQYGNKPIKIGNEVFTNVKAAANIPAVQCQDFMDPKDCHLLFNVCDPVICPASRCDFGGKYPVADVVQSGIIGSTLLCLPNVREKIVVPVCLTGIHAGIDSYVSILKSHRDCLTENIKSGKTVGICDQITSVYLCEFFWRQLAPLANVIIPKLVEAAYGGNQGARGGGEYLTVMGAWQNMQKSLDYFTQTYAVNSLKAYRIRSIEDAGTQVCKAFVSAGAPTKFDSLVEPDSPPQFHAWFSSIKYSDATVPATAQYKVFYHIFAGKDSGVQYRVYLKNPPDTSYYYSSQYVPVAAGYISKGEYSTQTRDFTAPEGYKELCVDVNGQEECGFKQVSTSFAVNQIRDEFVKGELKNNQVSSEKECISGRASISGTVGAALTNTNPEAAGEEALSPQIYKRGIIRICSTANPGNSTNPNRFVDVGSCGEQRVRCWLDQESVDRAITENNIGAKKDALEAIKTQQIKALQEQGNILREDQATALLSEMRRKIGDIESDVSKGAGVAEVQSKANELLLQMDTQFGPRLEKLIYNPNKAEVLLLKAQAYGMIAEAYRMQTQRGGKTIPAPSTSPTSTSTKSQKEGVTLKGTSRTGYQAGTSTEVIYQGNPTGVILSGNKVTKDGEEIGSISSLQINLLPIAKQKIPLYYDAINGAKITPSQNGEDSRLIKQPAQDVDCKGKEILECAPRLETLSSCAGSEREIEFTYPASSGGSAKASIKLCKKQEIVDYYNERFKDLYGQNCASVEGGCIYLINQRPYWVFVNDQKADLYVQDVASQLRAIVIQAYPRNEEKQKEMIARFVLKASTYETDVAQYGCRERASHPYEVLYHEKGDCEDSGILLSKLYSLYGFKNILLIWESQNSGNPGHLNNAVACADCKSQGKKQIAYQGMVYYVVEATPSLNSFKDPWVFDPATSLSSALKSSPIIMPPKVEPYIVIKQRSENPILQRDLSGKAVIKGYLYNYGNTVARNVKYSLLVDSKEVVKGDIGDMAQDVPVNFESKEFDIPSSWKEMRFEISSDELTKQTYVKWAPKLGQTSKVVP